MKLVRARPLRAMLELADRERQFLTSEMAQVKGLMPLLMKPRNRQNWSQEDLAELRRHLRRLTRLSPYLVVLAMPGGLAMLPALAWWLDRRRRARARSGHPAMLEFETDAKALRVRVSGDWTYNTLRVRSRELRRRLAEQRDRVRDNTSQWDLSGLGALDDAGAVWLAREMTGATGVQVPQRFQPILDQGSHGLQVQREQRTGFDPLGAVVALGGLGMRFAGHLRGGVALLGTIALDCAALTRRPREFPLLELSANVYRSGVTALPVTMLVGFLVGVVLTYLSSLQLKKYGADLLVINIVAIGVVRELGPMLASIIAAGRSGSTMTAQLGVMRVTEEIEALSVMGVSVTERLVLPKVLGLSIAMPLVAFCTDAAALAGGMVAAKVTLGISFAAFAEALPRVLEVSNFWIGIGKSVVFGFAVAFIACHYGLRVLPNTESLGASVTQSVVAAITSVILLDAVFAVLFRNIG
jgi:phospholipid/cholesterol/gamma-HCH transport system permease protein